MVFSSATFLTAFLPIAILGYYMLKKKYRNLFLFIISLFFYGWGEPKFIFCMLASIIANYGFAILIDKSREKKLSQLILVCMLVFNISLLFIFKYLNFFIQNINAIFSANITQTKIVLPIGVSFFTFQAISYVIDVYRGDGEVQKNPLNVGLYIAFFPQLIAGPIVRYQTIADQIKNRKETFDDFCAGICRFIVGLSKKAILANTMAIVADRALLYTNQSDLSVGFAWLGAIAYTFQIYFDFCGYSDMAIGLGKMFGFRFSENFNYPYTSKSITEFWRRWHISLSSWFRDYVYIPMGGSRAVTKKRRIFNLFVVWLLTGVWHGANWTFVVWGLFYFVLLIIEKELNIVNRLNTKWKSYGYQIFTILAVIISWVIFASPNLKGAIGYISTMFGVSGNQLIDANAKMNFVEFGMMYIICIIASCPVVNLTKNAAKKYAGENLLIIGTSRAIIYVIYVVLFLVSIAYCIHSSYNPFIYFNF